MLSSLAYGAKFNLLWNAFDTLAHTLSLSHKESLSMWRHLIRKKTHFFLLLGAVFEASSWRIFFSLFHLYRVLDIPSWRKQISWRWLSNISGTSRGTNLQVRINANSFPPQYQFKNNTSSDKYQKVIHDPHWNLTPFHHYKYINLELEVDV